MNKMTIYGVDKMAIKTSQSKVQKTSRGMRKHVRRMKQESRKTGLPVNELKKRVRLPRVPKTKKKLDAWDIEMRKSNQPRELAIVAF